VYSIDYRPSDRIAIEPIEFDDTVEAVKAVRTMPFIDPSRIGLMGGSHGAQVLSRVVSRVDTKGAILCAPAALDLIEVKKAFERGERLVPILKKLVADMEEKYGAKAEDIEKDPHQFHFLSNVKSHNRAQVLDTMGDAGFLFFSSAFTHLQAKSR